jgi:hypothetical protein
VAVTQNPACPAVFVPQSESVLHVAVHHRSLLQSPAPPSAAVQLPHCDELLDEQGSPTRPFVPAQMLFDPGVDVIGWHVVPLSERQSMLVEQPGKQM